MFDNAKSRYGSRDGCARANHIWTSGLVAARTKYGKPIVTASSAMMCRNGAAPSSGFHIVDTVIGSDASDSSARIA